MTPIACRLSLLAAVLGAALVAAPAARAFTLEYQGDTNSDGSAKIVDPDKRFSSGQNGQNTIKQGNTTLQFGGRPSFQQQYNSDRLFDPGARLNDQR